MTKNNTQQPLGRRRCAGGRTDRGSAIILVLVSMVLMAILAGSLLQLTRFERIPRSESNIEVVIESVINEILNQATDDLLDDAGNYLNAGNTANGGGDEPWDLPWTRPDRTLGRTADYFNGTSIVTTTVYGGLMDDSWIASHAPDFRSDAEIPASSLYDGPTVNTTVGMWRKITNLTGVYLGGDAGSGDLTDLTGGRSVPYEYPINNSGQERRRDSDLATNSTLLVDVDGDGIGDSRWEWAPLRQVGATQYVMAVRIVDLSARVDLNVALGSTPSPISTTGTLGDEDPRGDGPTELDGAGFAKLMAVEPGSGVSDNDARLEWRKVLDFLQTSPGDATTVGGATDVMPYDRDLVNPDEGTRRDYWTDGASRVSNTFVRNGEDPSGVFNYTGSFGFNDAWELLQGNGVGSAATESVENLMPNFLRRDGGTNGQEGNYATGTPPEGWTQEQFWRLDPRKHMSPFTGSANAAKPATAAGTLRELKVDVNRAVETGNINEIRDAILRATDNNLANLYPHLSSPQALADQLAANIADYIDDDNHLTKVGTTSIGFEALPYITEVYVQRHYTVTAIAPGTDALGNPTNVVTWDTTPGSSSGYAIEIGNPMGRYDGSAWHGQPIKLTDIWIKVGANSEIPLNDPSFGGDTMPDELQPGEVVIIYLNPTGGDPALNDLTALWASASGGADIVAEVIAPSTMLASDGRMDIGLYAREQGTTGPMDWFYSGCRVHPSGREITETIPQGDNDFATAVDDTSVLQLSYAGIGEGLNMMTVHPRPQSTPLARGFGDSVLTLTEPRRNRNDSSGVAELSAVTPAFESHNKPGAPPNLGTLLETQQIVWPDSERERMHWIGDVLQIPLIGPNYTASGDYGKAMAQAFINADATSTISNSGMDALLLPYQATTPVVDASANSGVLNYPQGLLILEQLTTFSPATDGKDVDNADGDDDILTGGGSFAAKDDGEVLVPGRININTASEEVLAKLLPFPDEATRKAVAAAIIERREHINQATGYGMGLNGIPGIAYTTALYEQIATLPNSSHLLSDGITTGNYVNTSTDLADTVGLGASSTRIDLNDFETTLGNYISADNVIDDREEKIMLAKWLTEVAETRSDVFAAYIMVQGFPADNFTEGASESAKLIVIFSRAGVKTTGDKAVELGRFRIN
jgi:hypothetical protein